jgi:glucose-1-phosphate cytidylyltransferase
MERLASEDQLLTHWHGGFWQSIDKLRDKLLLEKMRDRGNPPWKIRRGDHQ